MLKSIHFSKLIGKLVISVPFLTLSFYGTAIVNIFAGLIYWVEKGHNDKIQTYLDALWWSFSTTTTVGYGDITPITIIGRLLGIGLMLVGVAIFGVYTALFARAILDDEIYMG
jgi:voltage-gated potassium channel